MMQPMYLVEERPMSPATAIDPCRNLMEELHRLYLLSLLLTADHDKAEKCFVSAMGESGEGAGVLMEWACTWARQAVLKYAIQMIKPAPDHPDRLPFFGLKGPTTSAENKPFATIFALGAFERFVYVMSILEGQSEHDCAILLRCTRCDVMIARVLALTRLANADTAYPEPDEFMQA